VAVFAFPGDRWQGDGRCRGRKACDDWADPGRRGTTDRWFRRAEAAPRGGAQDAAGRARPAADRCGGREVQPPRAARAAPVRPRGTTPAGGRHGARPGSIRAC